MISAYLYTNPGGRAVNEDCAGYRIEGEKAFFVVADGLGGHAGGAEASRLVVSTLMEQRGARLREAIQEANRRLLEAQGRQHSVMKSTAAVLWLENGQALWAHVGDSRVYCLTGGRELTVTADHSVTYRKYAAGEITRRAMHGDEDRTSLLRAIGDETRCRPEEGGREVSDGDAFLLCSDGFWDYVYDEEILIDFLKSESPKRWAERMLTRAIARMGPSSDNLTLLTVFITAKKIEEEA